MSEIVGPSEPPPEPRVVRSRRDPAATRQRWVERMGRFRAGSHTVAQFCAAEGVSVPAFYSWKRALASPDTLMSAGAAPTFVPVRVASPASAIELALPNGAVLRFPAGTDPAVIAGVARQLGGERC